MPEKAQSIIIKNSIKNTSQKWLQNSYNQQAWKKHSVANHQNGSPSPHSTIPKVSTNIVQVDPNLCTLASFYNFYQDWPSACSAPVLLNITPLRKQNQSRSKPPKIYSFFQKKYIKSSFNSKFTGEASDLKKYKKTPNSFY